MKTVREILFKNFKGCTNHNCIIKKPEGIGTNGWCTCLQELNRNQIEILQSRLSIIIDKQIAEKK